MSEMIERSAKALSAKLVADDDAFAFARLNDDGSLTLDGDFDPEEIVRIVIAAMRNPTEPMLREGQEMARAAWGRDGMEDEAGTWVWQGMIDKALES